MLKESRKKVSPGERNSIIDVNSFGSERSFSFFPNPRESEYLANAPVEDLSQLCSNQADMSARFVHELWRIGRFNDISELARLNAIPDLSSRCEDIPSFKKGIVYGMDMIIAGAKMIDLGMTDPKEYLKFVGQSLVLSRMGVREFTTPEQLSGKDKQELIETTLQIGRGIQGRIQDVQAQDLISELLKGKQ